MDRRKLILAGCGLAAFLAAPGCRSTRSEVPPGHAYSSDGRQIPSLGFSSDPRPLPNNAAGLTPGVSQNAVGQYGMPAPNSGNNSALGAPTNHGYGPPGTAGLASGPATVPGPAISPSLADSPASRPNLSVAPGGPTPPEDQQGRPDPAQSPIGNYSP